MRPITAIRDSTAGTQLAALHTAAKYQKPNNSTASGTSISAAGSLTSRLAYDGSARATMATPSRYSVMSRNHILRAPFPAHVLPRRSRSVPPPITDETTVVVPDDDVAVPMAIVGAASGRTASVSAGTGA